MAGSTAGTGQGYAQPRADVALEFFSGIGGFHHALRVVRPEARVACAFDVDDVAARVYAHNLGSDVQVSLQDVSSLTVDDLNRFGAGLWMLSPPCQPYTRQGKALGAQDTRATGLAHLTALLADCALEPPERLLMENVVGFESSESRHDLVRALRGRDFAVREFWLSPVHMGVPNQRTRYFLLAVRAPLKFLDIGEAEGVGMGMGEEEVDAVDAHRLPDWTEGPGRPLPDVPHGRVYVSRPLSHFLEEPRYHVRQETGMPAGAGAEAQVAQDESHDAPLGTGSASCPSDTEAARLPAALIDRYGQAMDIVCPESRRSCCFTKNYARYVKGTGSVLAPGATEEELQAALEGRVPLIALGLRFLTPREIANLHGFPSNAFSFPDNVGLRKRYALIGNSLSVDVVSSLLRYLLRMAARLPE